MLLTRAFFLSNTMFLLESFTKLLFYSKKKALCLWPCTHVPSTDRIELVIVLLFGLYGRLSKYVLTLYGVVELLITVSLFRSYFSVLCVGGALELFYFACFR